MEPTLTNHVDIRLGPELVPYEELRVGDIIVFRQEDGPPGRTFLPEWNDEHNKYQFIPDTEQEEAKKYIRVMHRVISINKNGLITKGDNNEFVDFFPVKADDYQGKIIWHMNHIDWLFKGLYRYDIQYLCSCLYIVPSICEKDAIALIKHDIVSCGVCIKQGSYHKCGRW